MMPFYTFQVKNNSLFLLYLGVLLWLSVGIIVDGTIVQVAYLIFYGIIFTVTYLVANHYFRLFSPISYETSPCPNRFTIPLKSVNPTSQSQEIIKEKKLLKFRQNLFFGIILCFSVIVMTLQLLVINEIPILSAALTTDYYQIVWIRQNIVLQTPNWLNYLTSITIRAILPILCIVPLLTKRYYWFITAIFISTLFCCALLQKSYIALVFIPVILFSLIHHNWKTLVLTAVIPIFGVILLMYVTNPSVRPTTWNHALSENYRPIVTQHHNHNHNHNQNLTNLNKISRMMHSLNERLFVIPGAVIARWFSLIPATVPYGNGCGNRVIAKYLNCQFINYPIKLYQTVYIKETKLGITGSYNAASFMEWYADFGFVGLFISGIELGLWIAFLTILFKELKTLQLVINAPFILLLSSSSFHTLLVSGGWAVAILLAYLLKNLFNKAESPCVA